MAIDRSVICAAMWRHQDIETNGDIRDCCAVLDNEIKDSEGRVFNVNTHKLSDEWNSERKKALRLQMLRGEKPKGCWWCYDQEATTGHSVRTSFNNGLSDFVLEPLLKDSLENGGHLSTPPVDFQMQTGNLCNLACKMCQPKLSIQVGKFYKEHFDHPKEVRFSKSRGFPTMVNNDSFDLVYDWPVQHKLSDVFDEYIQNGNIKRMYLTGGEPTIIAENLEFLQLLVNNGQAKDIKFDTNTNCTNINKKFLSIIEQFKNARLAISIDGMGDIAHIQRYPSDWKTIERNIDTLIEWSAENPTKRQINLSTVVTALNFHHIPEFWDYMCEKFGKLNPAGGRMQNPHFITPLWEWKESSLGFGQVPQSIAQQILSTFDEYQDKITKNAFDSYKNALNSGSFAPDFTAIHEVLDTIQKMHPDLNIPEIYKIYYQ
jgi:MoaA/NifB/PqqE/SkfB family radical SAM enzyme